MSRYPYTEAYDALRALTEWKPGQGVTFSKGITDWQAGYDEGRRMGTKTALSERDQLKAELCGLRTGFEAQNQVNAELKAENEALRKDAERYQWICANACDLNFYAAGPTPIRGRVEIDAEQYPVSEWGSAKPELDSIIDAALGKGEQP
ncbi:hypothetical protein SAMN05660489_04370 [Pseudomonas sp. LAMO17WK12:I10]|uniref:hypothetical protein n=1 Tax=unclassified Pseudomonas TaxID=196821 RepID=UPI000BCBBBB5|nr:MULTISPECIES: hypothetical protein [unclassified Pseudomonas]PXX60704.1 hypothetical protein H160_04380 [Pseudomonas sp. LAMO17WK12:I9]SNY45482.1 hypothetical protein SAMN05660489_04370 [Pseudomonas sp. LAMO17WK12:I10]